MTGEILVQAGDVARIIARVKRCGRAVTRWDAGAVWQLARVLDVRIERTGDGQATADGPREALHFLASALRLHKAALLRGACARCHHNLAVSNNGRCQWCEASNGRTYVYVPNSYAERAYLDALAQIPASAQPRAPPHERAARLMAVKTPQKTPHIRTRANTGVCRIIRARGRALSRSP